MTIRSATKKVLATLFGVVMLWHGPAHADDACAEGGHGLTAAERAWLAAHPSIRLGDDFVWPPFAFMDEKGVFSGISSSYVAAISSRLGVSIQPVTGLTWAQVIEKVKVGDIDILPAIVNSTEREAFLNFSKPYITFPIVIATHRDASADSLADLPGRRVGVVKGYITHELLAKNYPAIGLITFDSVAAALQALDARRIDALVDNLGAITYEARRLRLANVKIAATTPYQFELSMAVRKDWPALVAILDKCLAGIPTLEKAAIENTWLTIEVHLGVESETILAWGLAIGIPALVVLGVFIWWNRRLNYEVDIRKQAEMRLERLAAIVASSNDAILSTSPDGTVTSWNRGAEAIFGYGAAEVLGQSAVVLLPPDRRQEWADILVRVGRAESITHFETVEQRKDGTLIDLSVTISPLRDGMGHVVGMSKIARDIGHIKSLEAELKRSNAELEQFAYVASHDLRQPLRMVTSYLTLIERRLGPDLDPDIRSFIEFATGGARRMDQLILGLLEFSRIGKATEQSAVPLGEVINEALLNLEPAVTEAHANVNVAAGFPTVTGNRMELMRLFQNLLGNALKYRAPEREPTIAVGWTAGEREWILSVEDDGIGIAPEDRERIFCIFQRLVSQDEFEGTGIGLAICRKIVERHGGRIWVEGAPGTGSIFFFTLPAASEVRVAGGDEGSAADGP